MKKAFTLSEVLITLGIIGIVAAMTLPSLIARYEEKVLLTQFKKVYTTISQAYNMAYQEYGPSKDWGLDSTKESQEKVYNILAPYLNVSHVWGNKKISDKPLEYRDLPPESTNSIGAFEKDKYNFSLSDGTLFSIGWSDDAKMPLLYVDINGLKKPNRMGKDYFIFCLNNKNRSPFVTGFPVWWALWPNVCTTKAKAEGENGWWRGGACANWVIATGNMDYLHREISTEEWQAVIKLLIIKSGDDEIE